MKAKIETTPVRNPGIEVESESVDETAALTDIWCSHGRVTVFTRLGDGNIRIVIAPQAIEEERDG